jgi:hypothetical protein
MLNPIFDGILVFEAYKWAIVVFFIVIIGIGIWSVDKFGANGEDLYLKLAFAFGVGIVVFTPFAFLLVVIGYLWPATYKYACFLLFGISFIFLVKGFWFKRQELSWRVLISICFYLFLYLILRLAYLRTLIVPPYSDSLIHYQIIAGFLDPSFGEGFNLSLKNIFSNYYHFGFHSIAAWMVSITGISIGDSISIFGPLFLVISPISTGALAYVLTGNRDAAFFSGLLTAIGWSMPAFSVNWGKYPALGAITTIPAVLAVILYYWKKPIKKSRKYFIAALLVSGVTLLHSRALIFLILGGIVIWVIGKIKIDSEISFFQSFRFALLFIISILPIFELLSGFYKGIWIFIPVLVFAFHAYPRVSLGVFLFTLELWVTMVFLQVLFGTGKSIMDRQFFEMSMYLPLSLICGAGLSGMAHYVATAMGKKAYSIVNIILVGGLVANFFMNGSFYPDRCCNYFTQDDRTAFQWIENNTSSDSLFLISTFRNQGRTVGTDGGMWLEILAERPANKIPFNVVWNSTVGINSICSSNKKPVYIYSGGTEFSFSDKTLKDIQLFQPVFQSGKIIIYEVVRCRD